MAGKSTNWNAIAAIAAVVSILGGIAYSVSSLFVNLQNNEPPSVETQGDNSPAIVGNSGDVKINN